MFELTMSTLGMLDWHIWPHTQLQTCCKS